jgi:hypothetical protein
VDCYLDDLISVIPDLNKNELRGASAIPLAIHLIGRPVSDVEPIPRDPLISIKKLLAEGGLKEIQTVLGWVFDTHRLLILLPVDKFLAYSKQIQAVLANKKAPYDELDNLTSRLTYVGSIIPQAYHFLNQIRHLKDPTKNRHYSKLPQAVEDDLCLFLLFLKQACDGISLNLITFCRPTHIYRANACDHGIGGYSKCGRFWHWEITLSLWCRASISILEFMASLVGMCVCKLGHRDLKPYSLGGGVPSREGDSKPLGSRPF